MTTRSYLRSLIGSTNCNSANITASLDNHHPSHDNQNRLIDKLPESCAQLTGNLNHQLQTETSRLPAVAKLTYQINLQESMLEDFKKLLFSLGDGCEDDDDDYSDVTIRSAENRSENCSGVFQVHRCLLSNRCDYFKSAFNFNQKINPERKHKDLIVLDDDRYLIEQILSFIYLGQVEFENIQQLLSLWVAADKYMLKTLSNEILKHLGRSPWLNDYTVLPLFRFSIQFQQPKLQQNIFHYLLSNGHRLIQQRILLRMEMIDQLCKLLMDDRFECLENDLLEFIFAYITYHRHHHNNDNTEGSNSTVRIHDFDEHNIPSKYRLNLQDIGIVTIDLDQKDANDDDGINTIEQAEPSTLSLDDQINLFRCVRPNALIEVNESLKSFQMIYDLSLIQLWNQVMDQMVHDNNRDGFRLCYPSPNMSIKLNPNQDSFGLIKFERRYYFNQIHLQHRSKLTLRRRLSEMCFQLKYFQADHDNADADDLDSWDSITVKSVRVASNKMVLILDLSDIFCANFLYFPFEHDCWASDCRPVGLRLLLT